ncbi:MAG: VCBS repeat-containing protein [Verrucomicrobia bacterium]|nr:VCBS repeat-containing protein [Verrucomicrobiota bacterium]
MKVLFRCLALCCLLASFARALERVKFNHPGLTVDLGVGLWAWPVPADVRGNGHFDLFVACPDKPFNGVWLFETPTGDTAKNPFPIFKTPRRLSAAVHYVTPSYVDGRVRVLSPATEYPDFLTTGLAKSLKLGLPANIHTNLVNPQATKGPRIRHNQWRYVDYDGDGALDLVVGVEDWSDYGWDDAWDRTGKWTNGPLHGFVYWLKNLGTTAQPRYDTPRKVEAGGVPVDVFGCPSPNFADFSGSGKLDLICGEFLDGFTFFENIGTRTQPRYAPGRRLKLPGGQPLTMDLEMIVPVAFDWNKDGHPDLIVGDEDGAKWGYTTLSVADWDGDGLPDLIVNSIWGKVVWFKNIGTRKSPKLAAAQPIEVEWDGPAPTLAWGWLRPEGKALLTQWRTTPFAVDWNRDGLTDLVMLDTEGYLVFFERTKRDGQLILLPPKRIFCDEQGQPLRLNSGAAGKSGRRKLCVVDWDGDGKLDLLLNGENANFLRQVAARDGKFFFKDMGKLADKNVASHDVSPTVVDWNGDGIPDLLAGAEDGHLYYLRNPRSAKAP